MGDALPCSSCHQVGRGDRADNHGGWAFLGTVYVSVCKKKKKKSRMRRQIKCSFEGKKNPFLNEEKRGESILYPISFRKKKVKAEENEKKNE